MPARNNLDPLKMLSLVEGEVLGDRFPDVPVAEREELLALIRSNPEELERYAHLKLGVTALCEMPRLDAPEAVWEHLDAHFEEALEGRPAARKRGRVAGDRGRPVLLRRWALLPGTRPVARPAVRRIAIAVACLLVVIMGLWIARGLGPSPSVPRNDVIFVQGKPKSSPNTAPVMAAAVVVEFFAKVPKRIQGVSPEAEQRLLDTLLTED